MLYLLVTLYVQAVCCSRIVVPNLPPHSYVKYRDINLAAILSAYTSHDCKEFTPHAFHWSEAVAYAIEQVNANSSLLPDLKLGYVILDDCNSPDLTVVQAVSLIRELPMPENCTEDDFDMTDVLPDHKVVGAIGCSSNTLTRAASMVLRASQIPLVNFISNSHLADRSGLLEFYLRVKPDIFQNIQAIKKFLNHFQWNYVTVLYSDDLYGDSAYQLLRQEFEAHFICQALSHKFSNSQTLSDYTDLVEKLQRNAEKSRVIVTFIEQDQYVIRLLEVLLMNGASNHFVWMLDTDWDDIVTHNPIEFSYSDFVRLMSGSFLVHYKPEPSESYNEHIKQMNPKNTMNPWFKLYWSYAFGCDLKDPKCMEHTVDQMPIWNNFQHATLAQTAVLTYAHAIHNLRQTRCKNVADLYECLQGSSLYMVMLTNHFFGPRGHFKFTETGSAEGVIEFEQIIPDKKNESFGYKYVAQFENGVLSGLEGISFHYFDNLVNGRLSSRCSPACKAGALKIVLSQCCWNCLSCLDNEILDVENATCEVCPAFYWPDSTSRVCLPIKPQLSRPDDDVLLYISYLFSIIGVITTLGVVCCFIKYRNSRIIKATSKELSFIQLSAIITGFLTVPVLHNSNTDAECILSYFMYCLSFVLLYAPILVKAIRIHRIFTHRNEKKLRITMIKPPWMVFFSCLFTSIQLILCIIMLIVSRPNVKLLQYTRTEKHVELQCDWTVAGILTFLIYNNILLVLSSIFAFKTRTLPDNFNESHFIAICVYTTLVIWLAFIPAYFQSNNQRVKLLLKTLSLLINLTVPIVLLFLPKIYAAVKHIKITNQLPRATITERSVITSTMNRPYEPKD